MQDFYFWQYFYIVVLLLYLSKGSEYFFQHSIYLVLSKKLKIQLH